MPENELLDSEARAETRWRPLRDRLERGDTPDGLFPDVQQQFYQGLRCTFTRWRGRGVDPGHLFAAAVAGPAELRRLVRATWNDRHARQLQDAVAGLPCPDLGAVIRAFLDSLWEEARWFLQLDCLKGDVPESFLQDVEQMLGRLAHDLLKDPTRVPRRPRNAKRPPDVDDLLDEPLPLA